MNENNIEIFRKAANSASSIVLVPHKNPDGDAIGSSLALYHHFQWRKKKVHIVVQDAVPPFLTFLPGAEDIVVLEKDPALAASLIAEAELIVCMDYSQLHRCGNVAPLIEQSKAFKATIDHHPDPEDIFGFYRHDVESSSTSELVYLLLEEIAGERITNESAVCMYTGMLTDTGCFKYALRPETFRVAANLLVLGVPAAKITTRIFDANTPERIQLLGFALNEKLVILPEYRTAYISLTKEEMERFHLQKGDTEGLVNYTLSIQNMVFGVFFHEREPGKTKISFRSKGDFPANEVSGSYFNGGGHKNAAGGQYDGPVPDAIAKFLEILPQYKSQLESLVII